MISVYDKSGLDQLAGALVRHGVRLISTGNTYRHLVDRGLPVTMVSEVTGFPEILGGRVKSLHPKVHGGILAQRGSDEHRRDLMEHGIDPIDIVVANLYPFSAVAARPGATEDEIIEMIDIGGPAMIRAAAKNHRDVLVVTDPRRYPEIVARLEEGFHFDAAFRRRLALEAFAVTAAYDEAIRSYFATASAEGAVETAAQFPERISLVGVERVALRYGENPHQRAAFYRDPDAAGSTIARARQVHGVELSYNNIMDAAAALEMVQAYARPTAVAVKHANPCGLASAESLAAAFDRVVAADPVSIFGGIVACNRPVDAETAARMDEIFLEVIVAPGFEEGALSILQRKKNLRLLEVGAIEAPRPYYDFKRVPGGFLVQEADLPVPLDQASCRVVTERAPAEAEWRDLAFGWLAVKYVKSNAIVVAKEESVIGVGAGQMSRIQAAEIALGQAGAKAQGAILASDAFFPFGDVVEAAARAGVTAVVQPGGSKRDQESIDAANRAGMAMIFTGRRHFRH